MRNSWRFRCPEGHVVSDLYVDTFRCQSCGRNYPKSEMVDLKPDAEAEI